MAEYGMPRGAMIGALVAVMVAAVAWRVHVGMVAHGNMFKAARTGNITLFVQAHATAWPGWAHVPEFGLRGGGSPLHAAAQHGQSTMLEMLVAAGVPLLARDDDGRMALWHAADQCDMAGIAVLLATHASEQLATCDALDQALSRDCAPGIISLFVLADHRACLPPSIALWAVEHAHMPVLHAVCAREDRNAYIHTPSARERVTPLLRAVQLRHADAARKLLHAGAGDTVASVGGHGVAVALAEWGGEAAASMLPALGRGACGRARPHDERTPLHIAAGHGDALVVRTLLSDALACGVNGVDATGHTPLALAARRGHAEVADMLVAAGAHVGARNRWGESAVDLALAEGEGELAMRLLRNVEVNVGHELEVAAQLVLAMQGGAGEEVALRLLAAVENANDLATPQARMRTTPVHAAVRAGYSRVLARMLERLDPEEAVLLRDAAMGRTPMHSAADAGQMEALEVLLAAAPPRAYALRDRDGATPLLLAVRGGHDALAQRMLRRAPHAAVLTPDAAGVAPVHACAFLNCSTAMWHALLDAGGDLEQRVRGLTALDIARAHNTTARLTHVLSTRS